MGPCRTSSYRHISELKKIFRKKNAGVREHDFTIPSNAGVSGGVADFAFLLRFNFEPVFFTIHHLLPYGECTARCDARTLDGTRTREAVC